MHIDRRTDRLRYCREEYINQSKMNTVQDIAKFMAVSSKTVYSWETGKGLSNADKLLKLSIFYNKSYAWIAHGHGIETHNFQEGMMEELLIEAFRSADHAIQRGMVDMALGIYESRYPKSDLIKKFG